MLTASSDLFLQWTCSMWIIKKIYLKLWDGSSIFRPTLTWRVDTQEEVHCYSYMRPGSLSFPPPPAHVVWVESLKEKPTHCIRSPPKRSAQLEIHWNKSVPLRVQHLSGICPQVTLVQTRKKFTFLKTLYCCALREHHNESTNWPHSCPDDLLAFVQGHCCTLVSSIPAPWCESVTCRLLSF